MNDTKWRQKVYGPYSDAWKIIKLLQYASDDSPELFEKYMEKVREFADAYKGDEFADLIRRALLLRADDVIAKLNREEATNEMQPH